MKIATKEVLKMISRKKGNLDQFSSSVSKNTWRLEFNKTIAYLILMYQFYVCTLIDIQMYLIWEQKSSIWDLFLVTSNENYAKKSSYGRFYGRSVKNRPAGRSLKIDRDRPTSTDREH